MLFPIPRLGVLAGSTLFGFLYQTVSPSAAFTTGAALALLAAVMVVIGSAAK